MLLIFVQIHFKVLYLSLVLIFSYKLLQVHGSLLQQEIIVIMDRDKLKEILRNIGQKCQAEMDEVRSSFKVSVIEKIDVEYCF